MKNRFKKLVIISIVLITGFILAACPNGIVCPDCGNANCSCVTAEPFSSLSVQSRDIKSLYLSNITVNSGARSVLSDFTVPTLSYLTNDGFNAPVLFTSPSGKLYILEVEVMDRVDDKRIMALCNGYYELTVTEDEDELFYDVGQKNYTWIGALIDMDSGKVYDFSEFEGTWLDEDGYYGHRVRFIENDIAYCSKWAGGNSQIFIVDLNAATPLALPLNSGDFNPAFLVRPLFTINNKVLAFWQDGSPRYDYSFDVNRIISPKSVTWPKIPADIFIETTYDEEDPVELVMHRQEQGIFLQDLSGKVWFFTTFIAWEDAVQFSFSLHSSHGDIYYLLAEIDIDNDGKFTASNIETDKINFIINEDNYKETYVYDNDSYLYFYINAAGVGISQYENYGKYFHQNREAFLHNGVVLINSNGFIRLTKTSNEINVESVELSLPRFDRVNGQAFICKEGYLYWMDNGNDKNINRIKLEANAISEVVYTSNEIVKSPVRDWITASGDNIIFYQYETATEIHTYSFNIYEPFPQSPQLIATSDLKITNIVELDF